MGGTFMKSYFRMFGFLLAVCMIFFLAACVQTPNESGSKPSESINNAQNIQRIDEMVGKLESAAAAATTNLNEAVAVLTADFEAKQQDAANMVAQMNAVHTTQTDAITAQIQALKAVDPNDTETVTAAIAEAEALIAEENHLYSAPIQHSRTSECTNCEEKDTYQICTKCNALKWGKLGHTLETFYDVNIHWQVCSACGVELPKTAHTANAEGECAVCNYTVNAHILIIEKFDGESETLCGMIDGRHTVNVLNVDDAPTSVEALAQYDEVILVNVAYRDMPAGFEAMLHTYVSELGGGLLTVGGQNDMVDGKMIPHAYNREDMAQSTYYKDMLPVQVRDFHEPVAVMIVMDLSASMWNIPTVVESAAMAVLDTLSETDYCGLLYMRNEAELATSPIPVGDRYDLIHMICDPFEKYNGSGTFFYKAIQMAGDELAKIENVESKHIIVITDGDFNDRYLDFSTFTDENLSRGITMSIVGLRYTDIKHQEFLMEIAETAGGKYVYIGNDYLDDAPIIVANELSVEKSPQIRYGEDFVLEIGHATAVVEGIDPAQLSVLKGCYVTKLKNSAAAPLVSGWLPIYAQWEYGEGSVASFLCDLNGEWSEEFVASESGMSMLDTILMVLANETEENAES